MVKKKTPKGVQHTPVGILIVIVSALSIGACRCSEEVDVKIGEFGDSKDKAVRAAIQKLAEEVKICPNAKIYRIWWEGWQLNPGTPLYTLERLSR